MSSLKKLTVAIIAAAFCASTPVIAADIPTPPAAPTAPAKPDLGGMLKDKAASTIQKGQQKVDDAAANLQKNLGLQQNAPQQNATEPKSETLDVTQESVTVETPQGTATETTTTITPEAPAAPEAPASK